MAEVHDCFTPTEIVFMEDLQLAVRGTAWKEVLNGTFDTDGAVLWIRLNRPQARNGIDSVMRDELSAAFAAADLTASGPAPENPLDYLIAEKATATCW